MTTQGQIPVTLKSQPLQLNTSLAFYPNSNFNRISNLTHLIKNNVISGKQSSSSIPVQTCVLIWVIFSVCLLSVFLLLLYFTIAVYLSLKEQYYYHQLHSQCSVSSISGSRMLGNSFILLSRGLGSSNDSIEESAISDEIL